MRASTAKTRFFRNSLKIEIDRSVSGSSSSDRVTEGKVPVANPTNAGGNDEHHWANDTADRAKRPFDALYSKHTAYNVAWHVIVSENL